MARTLTPERQALKEVAVQLAGIGITREQIAKMLSDIPLATILRWTPDSKIVNNPPYIVNKEGTIIHNSGVIIRNLHEGLPPRPIPEIRVGRAEKLDFLADESVDIIITSPPYNLGSEKWPMGGNGRIPRDNGIGYDLASDSRPEKKYQAWQLEAFKELYRVAKPGASFFYNHKVRQKDSVVIHPFEWLGKQSNPWKIRQELIWDRKSTHNHTPTLFWAEDERIYWLTKGKPILPDKPIGKSTIWRRHGPTPDTWHPAPFTVELPRLCLEAVAKSGDVVLDPFGGSMTTCLVAYQLGYKSIGVDISEEYVIKATELYGWKGKLSWMQQNNG